MRAARARGRSTASRRATIRRNTTETEVRLDLSLDGTGQGRIKTTIPFLDHMLALLAKHGFFDLTVQARGDTEIDDHHTVPTMCCPRAGRRGSSRPSRSMITSRRAISSPIPKKSW